MMGLGLRSSFQEKEPMVRRGMMGTLFFVQMLAVMVSGCATASRPDFIIYRPSLTGYDDSTNQHFLVIHTPKRTFLGFWTQASKENNPDQRVVMSRSCDQGRSWSRPQVIAGDRKGTTGLIASWQFPVLVPRQPGATSGPEYRVYLFYNQNVGVVDAREDTTGALAYRWSDDDGLTWSKQHELKIRKSAISHPSPDMPENWVTYQCPIITKDGEVIVGFTRWASKAIQEEGGLFERDSEVWFLRFDNIMTEPDPTRLTVTTLPEGQRGLRVPASEEAIESGKFPGMSVAQEPTLQELSDGRFICVMRTLQGAIYFALSNDRARTWDTPRPLCYYPGGPVVQQPLASSPLYKLEDGRFVLIFHNNDGTANGGRGPTDSRRVRRPVFLTVGREIDHPDQPIAFTPPRLLADNGGKAVGLSKHTQIGTYPSLFEFEGRVYFWYPDRKHFLLGKVLTAEMLSDAELKR